MHCPTAFLGAGCEVGFELGSLQVFCPSLQTQRQGRTTWPGLRGPKWFRVRFGYRPRHSIPWSAWASCRGPEDDVEFMELMEPRT